MDIVGYTDQELKYTHTPAFMHECDECATPLIDVTPTVIQYTGQKRQQVRIYLSNVTTNPVVIQPHAIICEIQPATVTDEVFEKIHEKRENIIEKLNIDEDNILKPNQKQH
ncbi:hypothetical protein DPMN_157640 [Dreissena polymorpha]|uniref:Uncharacterized protein n=1 Tax=Dreissena polymorpha TaxID=45954 RepID=A0A9D4EGD1_DREPO|nr:hypothetical protein DPMN_157640 [Dreissena polymorpha]